MMISKIELKTARNNLICIHLYLYVEKIKVLFTLFRLQICLYFDWIVGIENIMRCV